MGENEDEHMTAADRQIKLNEMLFHMRAVEQKLRRIENQLATIRNVIANAVLTTLATNDENLSD